jgi:hypothetical protein
VLQWLHSKGSAVLKAGLRVNCILCLQASQ